MWYMLLSNLYSIFCISSTAHNLVMILPTNSVMLKTDRHIFSLKFKVTVVQIIVRGYHLYHQCCTTTNSGKLLASFKKLFPISIFEKKQMFCRKNSYVNKNTNLHVYVRKITLNTIRYRSQTIHD